MTTRRHITLLFAFAAACSGTSNEPAPSTSFDGGVDAAASTEIPQGLYAEEDGEASMAVWDGNEGAQANLAVDGRGYALQLGAEPMLTPISGACDGCADASWVVDVSVRGAFVVLDVDAVGDGPGFASLRFVPHDGFKPEFAPAPGVELWTGSILAISAGVDPPVLDRNCEITLVNEQIETFGCFGLDDDSGWIAVSDDDAAVDVATFETSGARYAGSVDDDRWVGSVMVDGEIVGGFDFTRLSP